MTWTLLVLPALTAAAVLALARRANLATALAILGSLASLAVAGIALAGAPATVGAAPFAEDRATGPGLTLGGLDLPLSLAMSGTSAFLEKREADFQGS